MARNVIDKFVILDKERQETIGEYANRCLQYNIINMILPPGSLISEKAVSDILSISKTPVREAFFNLSKLNLMEIYPQKGSRIALIDIGIIEETRFTRWVLEREVVKMVCKKHTDRDIELLNENISLQKEYLKKDDLNKLFEYDNLFHKILFFACNKNLTYNFLQDIMMHFNRARMFNLIEMDRTRSVNEHHDMLEAIIEGDYKKTVSIMDLHLNHVRKDLEYLKEKHPDFFKKENNTVPKLY